MILLIRQGCVEGNFPLHFFLDVEFYFGQFLRQLKSNNNVFQKNGYCWMMLMLMIMFMYWLILIDKKPSYVFACSNVHLKSSLFSSEIFKNHLLFLEFFQIENYPGPVDNYQWHSNLWYKNLIMRRKLLSKNLCFFDVMEITCSKL